MGFASEVQAFAHKAIEHEGAVFTASVVEMRESIKFGSAVTGAPAMPVAPNVFPRSGALRDSITLTFPDPNTAIIYTDSPYGPDVEDNVKGHTFHEGAAHGWKITVAGFGRIVDAATRRMASYG